MEITLLIMEYHGKIMELCFLISVETLLLTYTKYGFRSRLRPKLRPQATLDMSACTFLEDFVHM